MNVFAKITFPSPVTLRLKPGQERTFPSLPACFTVNPVTRTIYAQMPPVPKPLLIYGAADFAAAAADTPEDHAARVLLVLGENPQAYLQSIIDGTALPAVPPRVPKEISNWRCKAVLASMGLLAQMEAGMAALPEPERSVVAFAWGSDGKVARNSQTVLGMAAELGLTPAQIDAMFIAAEALQI